MGACALILLVLPATAQSQSDADLGAQLTRHLSTMKKDQQVLRFFEAHGWLLSDPRFAAEAKRQLRLHTPSLTRTQRKAAAAKIALARRAKSRQLAGGRGGDAAKRDLPRLRRRLPGGARRLALRVRPADRRPERPVPRPVPDGLERAAPLRARRVRRRAGEGRPPVLRRLGPRLEPVVLQALELRGLASHDFVCKVRHPAARPGSHGARDVVGVRV